MNLTDRRRMLAAMTASMALPALGMPIRLAAMDRNVVFPDKPLLLKRELVRELGEGAAIVVRRCWECRFEIGARGAAITGTQVDASVDAPAVLHALAELERTREVTGLFPMELDRSGTIIGWSQSESDIDRVISQAIGQMEAAPLGGDRKQVAKRYFAEIGRTAAGMVSQVPRDLFYPATGEHSRSRALDLPGGETGSFELTVSASARPDSGLLEHSERRIVTRIGDSSRTSRETWSLTG